MGQVHPGGSSWGFKNPLPQPLTSEHPGGAAWFWAVSLLLPMG